MEEPQKILTTADLVVVEELVDYEILMPQKILVEEHLEKTH